MKYIKKTGAYVTKTPVYPKAQVSIDLSALQHKAYEAFKLHWMICHGITAADLLAKYSDYWGEVESDEEGMYDFWNYLEDTGFNGEIWPCFAEFCDCEFGDNELMGMLLSANDLQAYKLLVPNPPVIVTEEWQEEYAVTLRDVNGKTVKLTFNSRHAVYNWVMNDWLDTDEEIMAIMQGNTCLYSSLQSVFSLSKDALTGYFG